MWEACCARRADLGFSLYPSLFDHSASDGKQIRTLDIYTRAKHAFRLCDRKRKSVHPDHNPWVFMHHIIRSSCVNASNTKVESTTLDCAIVLLANNVTNTPPLHGRSRRSILHHDHRKNAIHISSHSNSNPRPTLKPNAKLNPHPHLNFTLTLHPT